ncbi:hypothetical protein P154DRAFT_572940 [Amniculicola lignicola CBS 123094]|uniref:Uncharacterized protein n=1 Tax=Amniculicola lignicola CBS 123094 TaxID=1392246 RepID=A0A6A5WSI1_9PLEO|nr:hypothetical protein P154DRAFT_572940 [Amniculicola lignicola CBS 123094]
MDEEVSSVAVVNMHLERIVRIHSRPDQYAQTHILQDIPACIRSFVVRKSRDNLGLYLNLNDFKIEAARGPLLNIDKRYGWLYTITTRSSRCTAQIRLRSPTQGDGEIKPSDLILRQGSFDFEFDTLFNAWIDDSDKILLPLSLMQEWWAWNGKVFPFLSLPLELRMCVYKQMFGESVWPRLRDTWNPRMNRRIPSLTSGIPGAGSPSLHFYSQTDQHGPVREWGSALDWTCKQVRNEIIEAMWIPTTKHFGPWCFANMQSYINFGRRAFLPFQILNRVSLGFTNKQFFNYAGFYCQQDRGFVPLLELSFAELLYDPGDLSTLELLANIPTLKYLNFHFSVSRVTATEGILISTDPWVLMNGRFQTENELPELSCQKTFVDWFLTMTVRYLRRVPNVTLSGHVKNSTRRKWEEIWARERYTRQWYDPSREIRRIMASPARALPPPCMCEHPCHWWRVNKPHPRETEHLFEEVNPGEYNAEKDDYFCHED